MARSFTAASSQYLVNSTPVLTARPVTIACWFRPTGAATLQALVYLAKAGDATNNFGLIYRGDDTGKLQSITNGSGATASANATTNAWNHACGTYVGAMEWNVYLNGGNSGSRTDVSRTPSGIDTTYIANGDDTNDYFDGRVAEVGIWSAILDAAEIAALASGFAPTLIRPQSLAAYWPLFGNDSPEPDRWKSRSDLTLTNTPTKADHPRMYYPPSTALGEDAGAAAPTVTGRMFAVF